MVKAASQTRGQSGGVLIASDLAARHSCIEMPAATWSSARVVDAIVALTSTLQVRAIGFYGITAKYHKNYVELNGNILSAVLSRVMHTTLPCVVMGDFNCDLQIMPVWGCMADWGWKDAAVLNQERTGEVPAMTFKGETRIDYILLPPQLIRFCKEFNVSPYTVSDHSLVSLSLQFPRDNLKVQVWKTCRDPEVIFSEVAQNHHHDSPIDVIMDLLVSQGDLPGAYQRFVRNYELKIARAYEGTQILAPSASFLGRGKPKLVHKPLHCPVVRNPRNGGSKCTVDDAPLKFRQHVKQLRRIHTVVLQLRSFINTQFESALGVAMETWCSILVSTGYPGSFAAFALEHFGIYIPEILTPEHLPVLELLLERMRTQQTSWEFQIAKLRRHKYKAFLDTDWNRGGRAHALEIKPPPKQEISMLEIPYQLKVTRLRHSKHGPFWIACHETIPSGIQFVLQGDNKFIILEQVECRLRMNKPLPGPSANCDVILLAPTTELGKVTKLVSDFWRRFWHSRDEPDMDEVNRLLHSIPQAPYFPEEITSQDVVDAIRKSKHARARGPDNWSNEDLKTLDGELVRQLTLLYNGFQKDGQWPKSILDATVSLLRKKTWLDLWTKRSQSQCSPQCTVCGRKSSHPNSFAKSFGICQLPSMVTNPNLHRCGLQRTFNSRSNLPWPTIWKAMLHRWT